MNSNDLTENDWLKIKRGVKIKRHESEEWSELYDKLLDIEY